MFARFRTIALVMMCAVLAVGAFAQTSSTTGEINGSVTDSSGEGLPGVTVTATNVATGLTRTAYTETGGLYSISQLPPGTYRVSAELAGLGSAQRDNVRVLLGQAANVRVILNPSVAEEITVTAETPLVDATQSGATEAVTETQIDNLPILGRDFKDLVSLTPGVANSFGGRVAIAGARGTALDFNIDGANANSDFFAEERGGTEAPFVFSQAAIQEFQVIRTTYSAEYSRGGGGTVNAITKSGTNTLAGQLFYFLRDQDWADERTIAGIEESTSARDVDQYGFAIGGPIMRDRLFYFLNGDFQDVGEERTTTDIRNNTAFQALDESTRQAFITRIQNLTGVSFDDEFIYPTKENQETLLAKIDWNAAANHHLNVRWNGSDFNNFPSESTGTLSNQGDEYNTVNSYVAQFDSVLTNSMYNFALLQYSLEERPINPLTTDVGQIRVTSGTSTFFFGQREFLPNRTDEEKWEIKDTLSWMFGDHQVKVGGNYLDANILNLFVRDRSGDFFFNSVQDFLDNRLSRFEQGAGIGTGATEFDFQQWGLFVMDTWRPTTRLTVDYGIRYDYATMPKPFRNIYEATNPELISNYQEDDNNFAPRIGFAYDLSGDGRSVIRGGAGRYYSSLPAILLAGGLSQTSGIFNNYVFDCTRVECPTFPGLFTPQQLANFDATASLDLSGISPDFEAAESTRGSLAYEREVFPGVSVEVEGVYGIHEKQQRYVNVNAVPTGLRFGNLIQYTVNSPNKPYPAFNNVRFNVSDAEGEYTAATIGFKKIALGNSNLSWLAHYTWSETIDQDTNSRSTSTMFSYDPFNPELSEGPSDTDVTHRIVASATYELPYGFLVSGIYNWRTGQPYTRNVFVSGNATTGLYGLAGIGINVPVFVDSNGDIIDITAASGSTPAQFAEFLNSRGATILGRNTENQPDFSNLDMRLAKRFGLPAGLEIELIGEIFNVFNTANKFIVAQNQSEFNISQSGSGANLRYNITRNANYGVATGLDFNSPSRQYQLAAKLRF